MDSFFFIPASKLSKIDYILSLGVDHIIIDFEDSILDKDRLNALEKVKHLNNYQDLWYRIPLRESLEDHMNLDYLSLFTHAGINKFVLPKLKCKNELNQISKILFTGIKCILLLEHPRFLFDLESVFREKFNNIKWQAVGLGSHDLTSFMGMTNNEFVLNYPKSYLAYLSKAFDVDCIDVAAMDIKNAEAFNNEIKLAKDLGYNGKFIIHPIQLKWLEASLIENEQDVQWAQEVLKALPSNYDINDIEPFTLNGKIIEKMHIKNAIKILNQSYGK